MLVMQSVFALVVACLAGSYLDNRFGSAPWGFAAGFLAGGMAIGRVIYVLSTHRDENDQS